MRIGQLAELAGRTPSAIRYYERRGVLQRPRRTASGYRDYDAATLESLAFIKRAEQVGFSLRDISTLTTPDGLSVGRRRAFRELVAQKLAQIPMRRRGLAATEEQLRAIDRRLRRGHIGGAPERWLFTTEEAQMPNRPASRRTRRRPSAIDTASTEARRLRHHWLGAEHLLLGILGDRKSNACALLRRSGFDLAQARRQVRAALGAGTEAPNDIMLTPRAQRIVGIAQGVALPSTETTTDDLLIGVLHGGDSVALTLLKNAGVDLSAIEEDLRRPR